MAAVFFLLRLSIPRKGGGLTRTGQITVQSLFSPFVTYPYTGGVILTLELDCLIPSGAPPRAGQLFSLKPDNADITAVYEQVQRAVRSHPNILSAEIVGERFIVLSTDIPGLKYAVILPFESENASKNGFDYIPMQGMFFPKKLEELYTSPHGLEEVCYPAYVPYHLMNDPALFALPAQNRLDASKYNSHLRNEMGRYYEISGTISDFQAFSDSLGLHNVLADGGRLLLEGSLYRKAGE